MEIIFESKMNEVFHSNIQEGIRHYYDDLDFKNILDFVQEKLQDLIPIYPDRKRNPCGADEGFVEWLRATKSIPEGAAGAIPASGKTGFVTRN
ncbi:hypothetical protein TURU_033677 [Turdus rufiventris]|nr:hypothetical protein TURU_033677 [Turdus rufiventris]